MGFIHALAYALLAATPVPVTGEDGSVLQPAVFREAVEGRLREALAGTGAELSIEFRRIPPGVRVSGRDVALRPDLGAGARLRGLLSIPVAVVADGRVEKTVVVHCMVRTYEEICIVQKQVERHAPIGETDIVEMKTETTRFPEEVPIRRGDLPGLRARHVLRPGMPLWASATERIPVVFRGEPVTLLVRVGTVTVRAEGIAEGDGAEGSMVSVHRAGVSRLKGRVVGPRLVEVYQEQN